MKAEREITKENIEAISYASQKTISAFDDFPHTPESHFKLYFLATVSRLTRQAVKAFGTYEGSYERFPFLSEYGDELAEAEPHDLQDEKTDEWWRQALSVWEKKINTHLPLKALREACGLEHEALILFITIGLVEEDARFGEIFEALHGFAAQHRPTVGLLQTFWRAVDSCTNVRSNLKRLAEIGLIQFINADALRAECVLQANALIWDTLRGVDAYSNLTSWAHYREPKNLKPLESLIVNSELKKQLTLLPAVLESCETKTVIARGPQRNGKKTLLGALALALGLGVLEINGLNNTQDERWCLIGPLANILRAMPVIVLDVAPGEMLEIPKLKGYEGAIGLTLGKQGGVTGPDVEQAITLTVETPDREARLLHWKDVLENRATKELDTICKRFRLTGGNLRRAAKIALSNALLDQREEITLEDVQQASRALNRQTLDTLAVHVKTEGNWTNLSVNPETMRELKSLERRCRERERLQEAVGEALGRQLNTGVRALLSGPSGTGKTLAAKLLASSLGMDLYRLDLSTVINKYIGETEKNLSRIFSRVEELDVILLLDEGDALLTQRTNVSSSNDRYANLETNYLLQRLESFDGILIVTTNASERIDGAFQRRMDVVIDFSIPNAQERWAIWQMHLPTQHSVSGSFLEEAALRCELTGGQIRNAALHASLLALDETGVVTGSQLESAIRREYHKAGAICPLRSFVASETFNRW